MRLIFSGLLFLLLVGFWLDLNVGYRTMTWMDFWDILCGNGENGLRYTFLYLRMPRVLTSLLVGIGLAVSGCIIQGVSHNDMAEPGILGMNAGAGLFLAAFLVIKPQTDLPLPWIMSLLAFTGALFVTILDYRLASSREGILPGRLLLVGIAVSTAASSLTSLFMLRMSDSEYAFVQQWLSGSIWGATWPNVRILAIGLLILCGIAYYKSSTLNVLALGTQVATGLGVNVPRQNKIFLAIAVGMSAVCCAVGGGLSFIGLLCPHLAKKLVGTDYRVLLPTTVLTGATLMVYADIISRTLLSPREIPIGITAAVMGVPYFLYLLIRT